jgi:hypothetical protein
MMVLCFSATATATVVMPSSLESMTQACDAIVVGKVTSTQAYWEDNRIFTAVYVDVNEWVKPSDQDAEAIELKVMGGTVGDTTLEIDHAPEFAVGDEVVLFLNQVEDKYMPFGIYYGVNYLSQGADGLVVDGPVFDARKTVDLYTREESLNTLPAGGENLDEFIDRVDNILNN